jgi:ferric-dicitrate binding protein FerR (iron transport regulator)
METNESTQPDLITRYFTGEATPEEIHSLSSWIASDPANAAGFEEIRKEWQIVMAREIDAQVNVEEEWRRIEQKLSPQPVLVRPVTVSVVPEAPIIPGSSGGPGLRVYLIRASLIAAVILVLLFPAWIAYRYFTKAGITQLTASTGILDSTLPDGTIVTLNTGSSLVYPGDFGKRSREVTITGEGYFEVATDSLRPFIIASGDARVQVTGTSFYINTLKEGGNLEVVLVEGSVAVYFDGTWSAGKTIIPGEKAELFLSGRRIVISPNNDPNFLAWKTRRLVFLDDALDTVIETLGRVYNRQIALATQDLASCRLTATFERQTLESVLQVLEATLDIRAEITSAEIILYGKGCD